MTSNVYTKNEILQSLASKGYFIDAYTLDTFFEKWKVEAIFEDEQGTEFYDKNALDLVMNNLFNSPEDEVQEEVEEPRILKEPEVQVQATIAPQVVNVNQIAQPQVQPQIQPHVQYQQVYQQPQIQPSFIPFQQPYMAQPYQQYAQEPQYNTMQQNAGFAINDPETKEILSSISLSDGTPLMKRVQDGISQGTYVDYEMLKSETEEELGLLPTSANEDVINNSKKEEKKMGILEGALIAAGQEPEPITEENSPSEAVSSDENSEFDDMTLLSESFEAQEKLREYVVSELSKKNMDLTPKTGEFKLDVSERTINMIARTMAKKIASHVSKLIANGALNSGQLEQVQKENEKLEQKMKELEDQNKKLRLLLAESNRNLNSYKPSILGLYKKVSPNEK